MDLRNHKEIKATMATSETGSKTSLGPDESRDSGRKEDTTDMERHDHSRQHTQTSIKSTGGSKTEKKETKNQEEDDERKEDDADNDKDTDGLTEEQDAEGGQQEDDAGYGGDEDAEERHDDAETGADGDGDGDATEWGQPTQVSPRNFDSQEFLSNVDKLMENLRDTQFRTIDENFPAEEVSRMVESVSVTLANFQSYSLHTQTQLEKLRDQLKEIKDKMFKKIQSRPYDPRSGESQRRHAFTIKDLM